MIENVPKIFLPPDSICEKCGRPLAFKQLESGKWCPCDPDGSDHWDGCKAIQRRRMGILNADGTVNWKKLHRKDPPLLTKGRDVRWVWAGAVPPWDESLGEFRKFTMDEMLESAVCQPVG